MSELRSMIRAAGLKQKSIAHELAVSEPIVSRWVNGQADIPSRALGPLAKMLGVPVDRLLPLPHVDRTAA